MTKKKVKYLKRPELPKIKDKSKVPSGWSLYGDGKNCGISYSMLSSFMDCRERFRLKAVEGLRQKGSTEALEFGSTFHTMLELNALGISNYDIQRKYARKQDSLTKVAMVTYQEYMKYYAEDLKDMKYVESEKEFCFPFRCSLGKTVYIRGKRDQLYVDKIAGGGLRLQENKTKTQISVDQITRGLKAYLQPMIYLASVSRDYPDKEIAGVNYNCIRRTSLKRKAKETEVAYLSRVKEDIQNRPQFYFQAYEIDVTRKDIQKFESEYLNGLVCQLVLWWESVKNSPLDPWSIEILVEVDDTPKCAACESLVEVHDARVERKSKKLSCKFCAKRYIKKAVANPHHFTKGLGTFSPLSFGMGEYSNRVIEGSNVGLEFSSNQFPELDNA